MFESSPQPDALLPQVYLSREACSSLNTLREVTDLFVESTKETCWQGEDTEHQLNATEEWAQAVAVLENIKENWPATNPANRPVDFGWCRSHLELFENVEKSCLLPNKNDRDDKYMVGDVIIAQGKQVFTSEPANQFRYMAEICCEIRCQLQNDFGTNNVPTAQTLQP